MGKVKSCGEEIYQLDLENKTGIVSLEKNSHNPDSLEGYPPAQGYTHSQEKPERAPTTTTSLAECQVLCMHSKDMENKSQRRLFN